MRVLQLHSWNVTTREAVRIQEELRGRVVEKRARRLPKDLLVAGADISYDKGNDRLFAAVVVGRMERSASGDTAYNIVEIQQVTGRATFPYVPGLLSFREAPVLLRAFAKLRARPDVLLVDGQGRAHPRRFGIACHLGVLLDIPTIGCAKSRLIGELGKLGRRWGSVADLVTTTGGDARATKTETIGRVVRTKDGVKPVYVSVGHKIDLDNAVRIVLACCPRYRLPEPTRQAHMEVNRLRLSAHEPRGRTRK